MITEREKIIDRGREVFAGKKILFELPVEAGGANVVIDEARAMQTMGVDVLILQSD